MASAMAWALALAAVVAEALHFDIEGAKEYPVSRVVNLLKDMQKQLEKEADADEEIYSKMACYCETNTKGKTKAIADAEARISNLDGTITKMSALSTTINGELDGLKKEISKNEESLEVATALRRKQKAEFVAEEKEMVQSISALKSAIVVLSKHHGGDAAAFLRFNDKALMKVFATAQAQMEKHAALLQGAITPSQKRTIASLLQSGVEQPTFKAYNPQSGQIFGILNQMKETFETDLANSQKEEAASEAAFQELKEAKEQQIATAKTSQDQKAQQLANTDQTLAVSKEDKEDTSASLSADQKFLQQLKITCSSTDKEWADRQKMRQTELQAVAKAIVILSNDDARDLFSKTFNPSFMQVSQEIKESRKAAAQILFKAAAAHPQLSMLATSVRLDSFTKVKKAIDKMVTALLRENADEIKHKDYCIDELHKNEVSTQKKQHTKKSLESKIAGLKQTIKETVAAIEEVDGEIGDIKTQMERAEEDREAEKKDFEGVVADQRETQNLLKQALDVLRKVYGAGVVLVQTEQQPEQPPGFSTYKKSTASTGIIMLIEQIIADAKEMEAKAVHDEDLAVKDYAAFVKSSNDSLKAKNDAKVTLSSQKAQAEKDLTSAGSELEGTMTEMESLANGAGALHKSCDYTLKNFDVRQAARDEEVDALRQAKAFLSGMTS